MPDSSGTVYQLVTAHAAASVTVVGVITKKRYVKIAATFSGTHGLGTPLNVQWVFGHPMSAPAWQTQVPDAA